MTYSQPSRAPQPQPARSVRPPLSKRQRQGAFLAGAICLVVLEIGLTAVFGPILLAVILVVILGLIGAVAGRAGGSTGWQQFWSSAHLDPLAVLPWVLALMAVGLLVIVLALLVSRWILKGHGVNRPAAVTWSAAGVAVVAQWIVGGIVGATLQAAGNVVRFGQRGFDGAALGFGIVFAVVGLAVMLAVGALSWWWMAHVFRSNTG